MGLKQARRWFVFPREFSSLFRASRVQLRRCSGNSAGLLRCRVTSPGKLSSATVDFVAPLRLWHGLRPINGWFRRRGSSGPARVVGRSRENGKRSFRDVQAMFKRVRAPEEERRRVTRASSFQLSGLDAAHRRLIESDCPYGAELHPCPWFSCKAFFMRLRNNFYPCIKLLSGLHIIISHSLSYWFI